MASHKSLARLLTLVLLVTFLVSACGDDRRNQRSHTSPDAEIDDASNQTDTSEPDDHPWEGRLPEECRPAPRGKIPSADEPDIANRDRVYGIELSRWNIANNATNAEATTDGLNAAIAWAHENNFGTVRIPAGHYRVGKKTNDQYTEAIKLPGNIALVLDDAATIEMAPNDTWNYCVIEISGKTDVVVSGGTIRGERDAHTYTGGGAHDEGHTICIWNQSERVLIENMHLTRGTGDGVLIVGGGEAGSSSKHIIIRNNEISEHRRQGVSIVGGTNVLIEGNQIHHISGTSPQFGVDIESLNFRSEDILIRDNHFHANQGGDYVNTDGRNVWFVENILDQTGLETRQTDGPIVHWGNTDQTIHGNTITVTAGSSNGRWGIIGYTSGARTNPAANYITDNTFHGGGLHMANTRLLYVTGNTFHDWTILGTDVSCLTLDDNAVNYRDIEPYKFRNMLGTARGNLLNGEPFDLPMTHDEPFTNSPPHMW